MRVCVCTLDKTIRYCAHEETQDNPQNITNNYEENIRTKVRRNVRLQKATYKYYTSQMPCTHFFHKNKIICYVYGYYFLCRNRSKDARSNHNKKNIYEDYVVFFCLKTQKFEKSNFLGFTHLPEVNDFINFNDFSRF